MAPQSQSAHAQSQAVAVNQGNNVNVMVTRGVSSALSVDSNMPMDAVNLNPIVNTLLQSASPEAMGKKSPDSQGSQSQTQGGGPGLPLSLSAGAVATLPTPQAQGAPPPGQKKPILAAAAMPIPGTTTTTATAAKSIKSKAAVNSASPIGSTVSTVPGSSKPPMMTSAAGTKPPARSRDVKAVRTPGKMGIGGGVGGVSERTPRMLQKTGAGGGIGGRARSSPMGVGQVGLLVLFTV